MNLPSKWIEEAVDQMSSLPGIGKKTALRLVLSMMKRSEDEVERFSNSFKQLRDNIKECSVCHNLSDFEKCGICQDPRRDEEVICVVEDIRDVMAIESTSEFKGVFHVLGGIISPMDGVSPADLNIVSLIQRVENSSVKEVIFALSTNMEGETTAFFLYKKLAKFNVTLSAIARGISIGDELQYADEVTLARSIAQRTPYETAIKRS
ncbi:MAG: recombination mediator RecR [Flavobacteriales bacterium]